MGVGVGVGGGGEYGASYLPSSWPRETLHPCKYTTCTCTCNLHSQSTIDSKFFKEENFSKFGGSEQSLPVKILKRYRIRAKNYKRLYVTPTFVNIILQNFTHEI